MEVSTEYLGGFLDRRKRMNYIKRAKRILRKYDFDAIAFRGFSGALIGGALAIALDKHPILVRKQKSGHSSHLVEGVNPCRKMRYIVVDDFTSSGKTVRAVVNAIASFNENLECVGFFAFDRYNQNCDSGLGVRKIEIPMWPHFDRCHIIPKVVYGIKS